MTPAPGPIEVLRSAIRAVPAVKYALGIAGIVAAIALVEGLKIDFRIAVFGTVIMLVLMTVLVIFAKAAGSVAAGPAGPAIVLTWFALLLMMATATALFTSVFFKWPLDLQWVLQRHDTGNTDIKPPAPKPSKSDISENLMGPGKAVKEERDHEKHEQIDLAHEAQEFVGVWDSDELDDPLYTVPDQGCVQDLTKKFELEVFETTPNKFAAKFRHLATGSTHVEKPGEVLGTPPCSSSIPPFRGGHEFPTSIVSVSKRVLSLQIDAWQQEIVVKFRRIGDRLTVDPNQLGALLNNENRISLHDEVLVLFRR